MLSPRRKKRLLPSLSCVVLAGLALSGCGSSSSSSAQSPSSGSSAPVTAVSSPASSASSAPDPSLVALQASLAKAEAPPTTIPLATPLKSAPPKGKTYVFLQCEQAQCKEAGEAAAQAASAIGWTLKTIGYNDSDPSTITTAFAEALQDKPVGIAIAGTPQVLWQADEAKLKAANVPIVSIFIGPATLAAPLIANIGNAADNADFGRNLADYFIVNSDGKGKALLANVPTYQSLDVVASAFSKEVAAKCPGCSVSNLDVTAAALATGALNADIIASLQKDPSIGYVMATDGVFVDALPGALSGAGLSKIKILAQGGDAQNIADLKTGKVSAISALSASYAAWLSVDATLRHLEGMPMPSDGDDGGVPQQLMTSASVGTVSGAYKLPVDFPAQFKKLWHVG
jgi:ribose transport system substrate-binding protein